MCVISLGMTNTEILHVLDRATTILASKMSEYNTLVKQLDASKKLVERMHELIETMDYDIADVFQNESRRVGKFPDRFKGVRIPRDEIRSICKKLSGLCVLPENFAAFNKDINECMRYINKIKNAKTTSDALQPESPPDEIITLMQSTATSMKQTSMPEKPASGSCVIC